MSGCRTRIFGEVLFDCFPDGSQVLGGAPFNVAWHLQAFGLAPLFHSRVGTDPAGRDILARMAGWGMTTAEVQHDAGHATGSVRVTLAGGEPAYEIVAGSAYDFIAPPAGPPPAADWLYHGTLAARFATSRAALQALRTAHAGRLFVDVNLRAPWWQVPSVLRLLAGADCVKLNADEFRLLAGDDAQPAALAAFAGGYGIRTLIVTRGERGAVAWDAGSGHAGTAPPAAVPVVDTVGAGDAFAAVCLLGLCRHWPLAVTLQRAQDFAGALVGRRGATVAEPGFYRPFLRGWS